MSEAIIAFIATDFPCFVHPAKRILGAAARSSHRGLPFSSLPMASGNVISPFSARIHKPMADGLSSVVRMLSSDQA